MYTASFSNMCTLHGSVIGVCILHGLVIGVFCMNY